MKFKYIKITHKTDKDGEQNHRAFVVRDYDEKYYMDDYRVVSDVANENQMRRKLSILRKHASSYVGNSIDGLDLMVMRTEDGKGYRLLTYARNWQGRASYYAGIIEGVERMRRSRRKKRKNQQA